MTNPKDNELTETESRLLEAIRRGASMEEIARLRQHRIKNPDAAIRALKQGNERFFSGQARRPEVNANERRAQILSQSPFAAVLGCSDSRVPIEIVFDQGLGDLFIIRVAGNVATRSTVGSIEYAIKHLNCHLVVVMGHEGCGAVGAAMLPKEEVSSEPEHVQYILDLIRPSVRDIPSIRDKKARMREAIINNVRRQVHELNQDPVIQRAVERGQIKVIGAFYEIGSGAVDFFIREEELALE